jgi:threonine dehydrogenase-like Zn-dependent dehydrogenase
VLGIVGRDGAHADILRLPARNLVAVPDSISDAHAVFVEPLAAACGVLERCPIAVGMKVAVIGDGKLGLLCASVLAIAGHTPLLVGKHGDKLAIAKRVGIETCGIEAARGRGRVFDVVVEASGSESGLALALDMLQPQGSLVLKSTFHGLTPVDSARIVVEEISVIGSRCGRFADALELLGRAPGRVPLDALIATTVPLARGVEAMETAAKPGILKVLLAR